MKTTKKNFSISLTIIIVLTAVLAVLAPSLLIAIAQGIVFIAQIIFIILVKIALAIVWFAPYSPYVVLLIGIALVIRQIMKFVVKVKAFKERILPSKF